MSRSRRSDIPTLHWPGKPDKDDTPEPVQLAIRSIHQCDPLSDNRLVLGDNLAVMKSLMREYEGRIDLIYTDPPFFSGHDYVYQARVADGVIRTKAYQDRWSSSLQSYLDMIYLRLELMRKLLSDKGSIYVHLDASVVHYVKILMDEIFGQDSFQREIIWRIGWCSGFKSAVKNWVRNHDTILFYVKTPGQLTFNKSYLPYPPGYKRRKGKSGQKGYPIEDVWNASPAEHELTGGDSLDSIQIKSLSREKTGFATQKNESLIRRIIAASSNPGDLVADFFCGSGTSMVCAHELNRNWLGCDQGNLAVRVAEKRLQRIGAGFVVYDSLSEDNNVKTEVIGNCMVVRSDYVTRDIVKKAVSWAKDEGTDELQISGTTWEQASMEVSADGVNIICLQNDCNGSELELPEISISVQVEQNRANVHLDDVSYSGDVCALLAENKADGIDLIDYWAVDWNYDGVFYCRFAHHKSDNETIATKAGPHHYDKPGLYTIAVMVCDIFGVQIIKEVTILI